MAIKAKLRVTLYAGDTEVAESEDDQLWHRVMTAIAKGESDISDIGNRQRRDSDPTPQIGSVDAVARLASKLGVSPEQFEGACSPSLDPPYLHLDGHAWETFKRNVPPRGRNAVSGIQISGTLLVLWMNEAKLGSPTQAQIQQVLKTIHVEDKNPSRGIKNCRWLQARNGKVVLNPALTSQAIRTAAAFCAQQPIATANAA